MIAPNKEEIPNAPRTFIIFDPKILPNKTFSALFLTEAKVTANSGSDVPIAARVSLKLLLEYYNKQQNLLDLL